MAHFYFFWPHLFLFLLFYVLCVYVSLCEMWICKCSVSLQDRLLNVTSKQRDVMKVFILVFIPRWNKYGCQTWIFNTYHTHFLNDEKKRPERRIELALWCSASTLSPLSHWSDFTLFFFIFIISIWLREITNQKCQKLIFCNFTSICISPLKL